MNNKNQNDNVLHTAVQEHFGFIYPYYFYSFLIMSFQFYPINYTAKVNWLTTVLEDLLWEMHWCNKVGFKHYISSCQSMWRNLSQKESFIWYPIVTMYVWMLDWGRNRLHLVNILEEEKRPHLMSHFGSYRRSGCEMWIHTGGVLHGFWR